MAINDPNLNPTVTVRRKAAKRSESWYQNIAAPLSTSARKKPRLEEHLLPLPSTADEAGAKATSPESSEGLSSPATDTDDANVDHATDTQPNAEAAAGNGRRTPEDDAKLTSAVPANTLGKKHKEDWIAIVPLLPGRTNLQCSQRWHKIKPSIALTGGRTGKWTEDEDSKLEGAVQTHGGKNWAAIAAPVPGRSKRQCQNRWHHSLVSNIDPTTARKGSWTEDEDIKLKNAVQLHNCKSWDEIATFVPGRRKNQCLNRWNTIYPRSRSNEPTALQQCWDRWKKTQGS
jgi:hypothetical protein